MCNSDLHCGQAQETDGCQETDGRRVGGRHSWRVNQVASGSEFSVAYAVGYQDETTTDIWVAVAQ